MKKFIFNPLIIGVALLLVATLSATMADGTIKELSSRLAAPQVLFFSGLFMALLSVIFARVVSLRSDMRETNQSLAKTMISKPLSFDCITTKHPFLLVVRSVSMVVSAASFFYAIAEIPLAEIFLFIGLMPLMSAVLSRPILGEVVRPVAWFGLCLGFIGVAMLFPGGVPGIGWGYTMGFVGAFAGTLSLVISRRITRSENKALVQVFYPNILLSLCSAAFLPTVWVTMDLLDVALVSLYSGLLFIARWTMVLVMQRLRAPVALPLMNIQFVWMVAIGFFFFHEVPGVLTVIGAIFVMCAGLTALIEQALLDRFSRRAKKEFEQNTPPPPYEMVISAE